MIMGVPWRTAATAAGLAAAIALAGCEDEKQAQQQPPPPPVAEAAKVDKEALARRAEDIRKGVEEHLAPTGGPPDLRSLAFSAVTVTPVADGTAFDVVVEGVSVGTAEFGYLNVGAVGYRLTPKSDDLYAVSDLRHAEAMTVTDAGGEPRGTATVRTAGFSGDWSRSLLSFTNLDWRLSDLEVAGRTAEAGPTRVGSAGVTMSMVDAGGGAMDQKMRIALDRIAIGDDSGGVIAIDSLAFGSAVNGFQVQEYLRQARVARERLAALTAAGAGAARTGNAPTGNAPTGEAAQAALDPQQAEILVGLSLAMLRLMTGFEFGVDLEGLAHTAAGGARPFQLATAGVRTAVADIAGERATVSLGTAFSGVVVDDPDIKDDPVAGTTLPRKGTIDVRLSGVPVQTIARSVMNDFGRLSGADEAERQAAAAAVGEAVADAVAARPMTLTIAPSSVAGDGVAIGVTGQFNVVAAPTAGLAGSLDATVSGLDTVLAAARGAAATSPDAAGMVQMLTLLKAQAVRERQGDGTVVDRFRIEVAPDAPVLVNGRPFGAP
jgi:hypothetical protein